MHKAQLKKRLDLGHNPGPGDYDPVKKPPIGGKGSDMNNLSQELIDEIKRKDRSLLGKLGISEGSAKKGAAFSSGVPRFGKDSTSRNAHNRSRTL